MLVSRKHKKLLLNLREPDRVTSIIPSAKVLNYKGQSIVAIPHRLDEVRVLRNLGFAVPAPVSCYYDYPGRYKPYIHQATTVEFLSTNPRAFCNNGMGSGKTISGLWAFDYLRRAGLVKRMLVIGPLSTLERAWGDEIYRHFPDLTFAVLHGTRERRHKLLAADFDIYIINHDGIKSKETLALLAGKEGLDLIVVDELAEYRNAATDRWKFMNRLINGDAKLGWEPKTWAWGFTGTPIPNAPTDAWAQVRLINPGRVGKYFGHFRDSVMKQITQFKWAPRDGALEIVREAMQPSVRFSREECIDLPPTTYVTRHAEMSPEQKKAYDEMLRQFKTEYAGGEITAVNAAVKLSKLLQIGVGVAYGAAGDVTIPSKPRMDLVREIIEEAEAKVIVFVPFTAALQSLAAELRKNYTVEVVHGGVSKTERDRIFNAFQQHKDPHVLVADSRTMAHGLTLTAANTTVWYGPAPNNNIYMQANERTPRPGQKLQTLIVHIEGNAVERQVYERLQGKKQLQSILLDLLKEG
jgi:SNF2 family DNA or RNA helicase